MNATSMAGFFEKITKCLYSTDVSKIIEAIFFF